MRIALLLAAAAALAEPAAAGQAVPAPAVSGRSQVVLPLTRDADGKLYAEAVVGDRPIVLLVDTGASTVLDATAARSLGLEIRDTGALGYGMTGVAGPRHEAVVPRLALGGLVVRGHRVSVLDLAPLRSVEGVPPFDGVIGAELLALLRARIDFDTRTLALRRPEDGRERE